MVGCLVVSVVVVGVALVEANLVWEDALLPVDEADGLLGWDLPLVISMAASDRLVVPGETLLGSDGVP